MAYKFQIGQAIMSGGLDQEGDIDIQAVGGGIDGVLKMAGSTAIDASRNATLAGISGSGDLTISKDKLKISNVAVTATAAELNFLDGADSNINSLSLPASTTISTFGKSLVDDADAATARTTLGLVIGSDVQAHDADLDTLSGMQAGAAGAVALLTQTEVEILDGATVSTTELNYLDGADSNINSLVLPASTTISAYGASLVNDLSASQARTTLGLGTAAVESVGVSDGNVAQFDNTITDDDFLRINGTKVEGRSASEVLADIQAQPLDPQLTDVAGLSTADGNFIVGNGSNFVAESGATARTSLGLGSIATQASDSVDIDGGAMDGVVIGGNAAAAATFTTAKVGDLTQNRVVFAGASGELSDSGDFTFDGADLTVSGRIVAAGAGDISGSGDLSVANVSGTLRYAVTHAANSGIVFSGAYNNSAARTVSFDLSTLSVSMDKDTVVGDDSFAVYDADASEQKKITLTELAAKLAGAGINSSNGVLSAATANAVNEFTANGNLSEGYNVQTNDADVTMTLPGGAAITPGDMVVVKAGPLTGTNMVTIQKHSDNRQMDGLDSIFLESPFAAVTLIYSSDSEGWKII